ncbi:MAG: glucose-6-phosphate isomerase [Planctomycetia bacterium]|nr:glucose-6-phosphate isomerase [Planctomycetia bacterium]
MKESEISEITYSPSGAMIRATGVSAADLAWLSTRLVAARNEVLDDLALWHSDGAVPKEKIPLDAGFIDLPERLLDEHAKRGENSELGRIQAAAGRLAGQVDRVVVLGIGGSYMGARALFEACCRPYHNELDRIGRGMHPRMYFEGNNVDNDAVTGLLRLLGQHGHERWGLVVISKSGGTLETAVAFRIFLEALRESCGDDVEKCNSLILPVTGQKSRLRSLSTALGCPEMFSIPEGVGGRFSIFTAVGLLPAALLGLDITKLLEGAAVTNRRFCNSPPGENPVLDYVGVCHLMEQRRGANTRVLSAWGKGLEAVGLWYDQLLAESLGKDGQGALPLTVVNTRDLHSRGQQHQDGRRDKLITNLIVETPKSEPLAIKPSTLNQDRLNELAGKTLPDILKAAIAGTNRAYADDHRPTADIRLPKVDESSLGQLFQMLMLATAVEGRLLGINPYGQPGVEAYKSNMNDILRAQ